MYAVDERDEVISLSDLPPSDPGATRPFIMQDEGATVVAYYLPEGDVDLTDEAAWAADPDFGKETVALVRFVGVSATYFGRPNDEAFHGHPLSSRGLQPYRAAEVRNSSWIRILERMNSVHSSHSPGSYARQRHIVLAFHDSTFECVARSYTFRVARGAVEELVPSMLAFLQEPAQSS